MQHDEIGREGPVRDEAFEDDEWHEMLDEALDEGSIDSTGRGIALKMLDEGYSALSASQQWVFDTKVAPVIVAKIERRTVKRVVDRASD